VADDLVQAGAARLRVAAVAQRGRVGVVVDEELVHHAVHLIRRDAGRDGRAPGLQRLRCDPARHAHGLDDLGRLHPRVGTAGRPGLAHVLRARDAHGDVAAGRDGAGAEQRAGGHTASLVGGNRQVGPRQVVNARRGGPCGPRARRARASPAAAPPG
jgi:hypothetical protein